VFRVDKGGVDTLPFIGTSTQEPGLGGATIIGQEFGFLYDSRDDTNIPRQGALGVLTAEIVPRALGSSLTFTKYGAEARKFIPFRERFVLAMRARADYIDGPTTSVLRAELDRWARVAARLRQRPVRRQGSVRRVGGAPHARLPARDLRVDASSSSRRSSISDKSHSWSSSPFNDLHAVGGLGFAASCRAGGRVRRHRSR